MFCPLLYLAGYCNDNFVDQAVEEDSIAFEKSNRVRFGCARKYMKDS